jgi:hypothetical protein
MNVIKTKADAIHYLQTGDDGTQILERLDQLPHLIDFDVDDAISSTVSDEIANEERDNWAELPDGIFDADSEDELDEEEAIKADLEHFEDSIL